MNDDIMIEILTRLPLKSYSRSKCVSKTWQALLSYDYVRSKLPLIVSGIFHPSNSADKGRPPTYVSNSDGKFEPDCPDFFPFRSESTPVDCSNGLLLFYSSLSTTFHICNMITKKYVTLPKQWKQIKLSILLFDPHHSSHFKVVSFTNLHDRSADLEIFDSKSWQWIEKVVSWGIKTDALSSTMRYVERVLYIVAQPNKVVAVDLNDDMTCRLIKLPEVARKECCLGKLDGKLYYSTIEENQLRIWMLKDDEKGDWVMKHSVNINEINLGEIRGLTLHPERTNVVYLWAKEKLMAYDVCEKRVTEVSELGNEIEKGSIVKVWVFPFSGYLQDCLAKSTN